MLYAVVFCAFIGELPSCHIMPDPGIGISRAECLDLAWRLNGKPAPNAPATPTPWYECMENATNGWRAGRGWMPVRR